MATAFRRPLAHRPPQLLQSPASKRSRSPEPEDGVAAGSKRVRTTSAFDDVPDKDKVTRQAARERRMAEKEQQKAEFRDKYRRAFPSWTFHLDMDHIEPDRSAVGSLEARIQELGGVCGCIALRIECR
jgi:regulatory subunit for Cdc7p protein kinase